MRGEPKSRSRRSSQSSRWWESPRSICALAFVALAPACGSAPATGVRSETGGNGGQGGLRGNVGLGGNAGTSGGVTGGAKGSGGGSPGSGGNLADAGSTDALRPFACVDDASHQTDPNMTSASGAFSGALAGAVCTGGAFARLESSPADDGGAPTVKLFIDSAVAGAAAGSVRFQSPANATSGLVNVEIGIPSASPGTYAQAQSCGNAVLVAYLPAPDPSICATDADTFNCPDGCELAGLNTCMPIAPYVSYAALGASDCVGDATTPAGSWTLTLTSLTPDPKGPDSSGNLLYAPHGTLSATLADQSPDAGTTGVSLTLSF